MSEKQSIRVLVIREEDGMFAAQCLEYDICTQAGSIEKLKERLVKQIEIERLVSRDYTGEEFGGIDPAPAEFHEMWNRAEALEDGNAFNFRMAA